MPWFVVALVGAALVGGGALVATQPWVETASMSQSGSIDTNGSDVELPAGDPVEIIVRGSDWDPPTGLSCEQHEAFKILATGEVTLNGGPQARERYAMHPAGALLVGLNFIEPPEYKVVTPGELLTFTCPNGGALRLGINDTDLGDNTGQFTVKVWAPAQKTAAPAVPQAPGEPQDQSGTPETPDPSVTPDPEPEPDPTNPIDQGPQVPQGPQDLQGP